MSRELLKKTVYISSLLLILFLTFIPRSVEVLNKNYLFLFDQGRDYLAVKDIVINHKLTLIGAELGAGSAGIGGLFHGPGYYYALAIPFLILQGDPYGGLLLMFVFSIAAVGLSFYLGYKMFGIWGGLVASLFVAVSPPLIAQARFVWNSHPIGFLILLVFYFIYQIPKKPNMYLFLSAFFSGFIYNFETADAIPMSIALIVYTLFILKLKKIKGYLMLGLGFLLAYSPTFLFELRHHWMGFRGFASYIFNGNSFDIDEKIILMRNHVGAFWSNFANTFPMQPLWLVVLIFLITVVSLAIFLPKEKNKQNKKFLYFLLLLPIINFLVFLNLKNSVWDYYLVDLNLAYIFLLVYISLKAWKDKYPLLKLITLVFLGTSVMFGSISAIKMSTYDYHDYGGTSKIKGKINAIDFIYQDAKGKPFGLSAFTPPIYTYDTDYLLWWYGKSKYGYLPYKEKRDTFYLLIEPDSAKPWSYEGWLQTVIKTGNVVFTKQLPSGYIVQKRIIK
jgi:hypothetical protein